MYDNKTVFRYHAEKTLHSRQDLEWYISNLGRYYNLLGREGIKLDASLVPLFKTFVDISQLLPSLTSVTMSQLTYENPNLVLIMQDVGIFNGAGDIDMDPEYSSVNLLFYSLPGFGIFVRNLADWLEKNDYAQRPTIIQQYKESE